MTWSSPAFEAVARLLGERSGLTFAEHRRAGVEQGIRRAMRRAGISAPEQYPSRLSTDDDAFDDLLVELTVGETYFFREPAQFDFIRSQIVPDVRRRWGPDHVFRAWSAGCASGEEPYSLAIVLDREGLAGRSYLLATDISRAALARAREAVYGSWSLRGEGAVAVRPFLRSQGDRYRLDDAIRRRVSFAYLNLALDVYPSAMTGTWYMDLILCRNVLIYFDRDTIRRVARRLFDALAPGGWLITASSDPPLGEDAPFETVIANQGVFYRRRSGDESIPEPAPWPQVASVPLSVPPDPLPAPLPPTPVLDPLAAGRRAFDQGDYGAAAEATRPYLAEPAAAVLHVRALANLDLARAEEVSIEMSAHHSLYPEIHYLQSVLQMELGRDVGAIGSLRRVLYLDRSLAIAHFMLGSLLRRRGDRTGARRAYRNAHALCINRPADEPVPLAEGEPASRLAEAAAAALELLEALPETSA
jgi:chemotaxis protein methyltransferase CheR